jgi:hypothetical protein
MQLAFKTYSYYQVMPFLPTEAGVSMAFGETSSVYFEKS